MKKFLLPALALLLAGLAITAHASPADPPPSCPPYHSQSFPGDSYLAFPPPGRVFCYVIVHDAGGRIDFPRDGCLLAFCVSGLHSRTLLRVTAPGEMDAVTTFAQYKRWLPVTIR